MYYIGLDLGTSSLKGLLVSKKGEVMKSASRSYAVSYPKEGWSEQNPEDWLIAAKEVIKELSEGVAADVGGISVGGQMHGLVLLDAKNQVIRPCILWNDGRTQKEVDYLNKEIGKEFLTDKTANIAFAGFTAPKILWVRKHEPMNFEKIRKICLPKDYLTLMLTGVFSTDYSDAGGTLLLDVKNKKWSEEMCKLCSVKEAWLPKLYESYQVTGKVKREFGLPNAVCTAGAGDNAAAAIGTGTIGNGACNISLGTSGTLFLSEDKYNGDCHNALHVFPHADGHWHYLGCVLSAASCNGWWVEKIMQKTDYSIDESKIKLGENKVFFLPYMMGERSPHNNTDARGVFFGLTPETTEEEMHLAVLEGVTFAIRDCLEAAKGEGLEVPVTNLCGGGAKNTLWRQLVADICHADVFMCDSEQGPSLGAALLAMVGAKEYPTVEDAVEKLVKKRLVAIPNEERAKAYNKKYQIFKQLYPSLKEVFTLAQE